MARSGKSEAPRRRPTGSWLGIKVVLVSGPNFRSRHPPGRRMLVSPNHTLAELAEAIDIAFARWDHSHLHLYDLGSAGTFMPGGDEDDESVENSDRTHLRSLKLRPGSRFFYVYDLGDEWRHECEVESTDLDTEEVYGVVPDQPVPFWGWGTIPDQYGRIAEDALE